MHVTAAAPTGPVAPPHLQPLPDQVAPVPLQAPVGPHAPVAIIHEAPQPAAIVGVQGVMQQLKWIEKLVFVAIFLALYAIMRK